MQHNKNINFKKIFPNDVPMLLNCLAAFLIGPHISHYRNAKVKKCFKEFMSQYAPTSLREYSKVIVINISIGNIYLGYIFITFYLSRVQWKKVPVLALLWRRIEKELSVKILRSTLSVWFLNCRGVVEFNAAEFNCYVTTMKWKKWLPQWRLSPQQSHHTSPQRHQYYLSCLEIYTSEGLYNSKQ